MGFSIAITKFHIPSLRSYWIPGSYAPASSEKRNSFLKLLNNKGFKEEGMTKVGLDAIGKSTTLESNKSLQEPTGNMSRTPARARARTPKPIRR
jgi:hypothetical protein